LADRQSHPGVAAHVYLPGLALIDFFLLRKVKEELAGLHLFQESLKNAWEGVLWSLPPPSAVFERFAKSAFRSATTMPTKFIKLTPY
jgi:hypothetical protein